MDLEHDDLEIIICALTNSIETCSAHIRLLGEHESLLAQQENLGKVRSKVEQVLETREHVWSLSVEGSFTSF